MAYENPKWRMYCPPITAQCSYCKHLENEGFKCKAFPTRVPEDIALNKHDHRNPYPGDNGILLELKEGVRPDWEETTRPFVTQCARCANYFSQEEGSKCKAFLDGIPAAILRNKHDHRNPYPGDNGILFEPKEKRP